MNTYAIINTKTGKRYDYGTERYETKVWHWAEDFAEPEDVACRVEGDALVPLHRKRIFAKWQQAVAA